MKFKAVFVFYSALLGFGVGIVSELFLVAVNFLTHLIWYTAPQALHLPSFYPIIIGLIGGVLVGLSQKYIGPFPKTLHETLTEFKRKDFPSDFSERYDWLYLCFHLSLHTRTDCRNYCRRKHYCYSTKAITNRYSTFIAAATTIFPSHTDYLLFNTKAYSKNNKINKSQRVSFKILAGFSIKSCQNFELVGFFDGTNSLFFRERDN